MITGVAIKYKGKLYELDRPARHDNIIRLIHEETGDMGIRGIQGFVTGDGEFLDRKSGVDYALENGQIKKLNWPPNLYSEDLW